MSPPSASAPLPFLPSPSIDSVMRILSEVNSRLLALGVQGFAGAADRFP